MTSARSGSDPADYAPVDISGVCNHAGDVDGPPAPTGNLTYRGLPFRIGDPADPRAPQFVVLAPGQAPVTVPIRTRAHRVVIAHRLLRDDADPTTATGAVVGRYTFRYADGGEVTADIRRRFEISVAAAEGWDFDVPFVADMSSTAIAPDFRHGAWDRLGERRSEASLDFPPAYLLWTWRNDQLDTEIESLVLEAVAGRVMVAGVTIGHVDEDPIPRMAASPVTVEVGKSDTGRGPVTLAVDRGTVSFTRPLAPASDDLLGGCVAGFGAAGSSESASRGYSHVAAVPSARLSVTVGNRHIGSVRWGDLTAAGSVPVGSAQVTMRDPGRTWGRLVVTDPETGRPVPCRIHIRSNDGVPFPPYGHPEHVDRNLDRPGDVRLGATTYAYIDGTCEGWLPRGRVLIEAVRGFEYEPLRTEIPVDADTTRVELSLQRWTSMNRRGWYSGDSHAHFLTAGSSLFEQQGEDLNVVNLLATQWGALFTGFDEFTGGPVNPAGGGPYVTYLAQENRQHLLGHLVLMGLREQVLPACTDGPPEAALGGALEATMSDWADRCHAQGGTVIVPHIPRPNGELAALVATGRTDGFEMIVQHPDAHAEYYRYLNCGYRMPLVGGTDKMSAEVPIGLYRTYAHLGDEDFSYDAWCRAVRAGRTFLTAGPLLDFTVDGELPGSTVALSGAGRVHVRAHVESVIPVATLQVIHNGRIVAEVNHPGGTRTLTLDEELHVPASGWFAARCGGPGYFNGTSHHDIWQRGMFAHSSPIYVAVGGPWTMFDPAVATYLLTMLEGGLKYVRDTAPRHGPATTYHHGEPDHGHYLSRPFLEAAELIRDRIERGS